MSVYVVASIRIHDRERYLEYQGGFLPIFEKYGGEILVVDDAPETVEGSWPYTRMVVLRFPDAERLRAWYGSPEYQALAKHRHAASEADIIVAKEFDPAMLAGN